MKGDNWLHNIDWEQSGLILGPWRKCVTHNAYMRGGRSNILSQMLRPRFYIYHLTPCEGGSRKKWKQIKTFAIRCRTFWRQLQITLSFKMYIVHTCLQLFAQKFAFQGGCRISAQPIICSRCSCETCLGFVLSKYVSPRLV